MSLNTTSLAQAIAFLTRPLTLVYAHETITSLQHILRTTISVAYPSPSFKLSLSSTALPPRPIYAACIATGIQWSEWFKLLGHRSFDLLIEPQSVLARYAGIKGQTVVVWRRSPPPVMPQKHSSFMFASEEPQIPISKFCQQQKQQFNRGRVIRGAVTSAMPRRTVAQQLLIDSEKEVEEELFSMVANFRGIIVSPTPTRENFKIPSLHSYSPSFCFPSSLCSPPVVVSPVSSPEPPSSAESSRPSSRASTYSFSDFDSESVTSVSSSSTNSQPCVYVDATKKDVTRYSYQGGESNVLTGGVMLGTPGTALKKTSGQRKNASWRRFY
jgi:hypothetical protein